MERAADLPKIFYRAFVVNDEGRLGGVPTFIEAADDRDATQQAGTLSDNRAVELWEGARLVTRLLPRVHALEARSS